MISEFLQEIDWKLSGINYIDIHLNGQDLNKYLSDKWFLKVKLMKSLIV